MAVEIEDDTDTDGTSALGKQSGAGEDSCFLPEPLRQPCLPQPCFFALRRHVETPSSAYPRYARFRWPIPSHPSRPLAILSPTMQIAFMAAKRTGPPKAATSNSTQYVAHGKLSGSS